MNNRNTANETNLSNQSLITEQSDIRVTYKKNNDDARKNLIRLVYDQGHTIKESAEILGINYNSTRGIINKFYKTGSINQLAKGGKRRLHLTEEILMDIEHIVSINPEYTLKEIKNALEASQGNGFVISISTIDRGLRMLQITFKISHSELDRVNSPEKIEQRKEYALWFNNHFNNDFSRVVFIDETSCNLHVKRSQARSRKGTRAIVNIPTVGGRLISMIASLSINKMCYCKTSTNSTVNADIFSTYISELCAYLFNEIHLQNACLILDNARIHRRADIMRITGQYGYEFKILSPYSYMLNPIENAFSQIKNSIRSRLRAEVSGNLSELLLSEAQQVTSDDTAGYFRYILRNITNCAAGLPYMHQ